MCIISHHLLAKAGGFFIKINTFFSDVTKSNVYEVGWKEKHALFPYPQSVIDMNPNIKQNPGW